jgi:hypothetical protein
LLAEKNLADLREDNSVKREIDQEHKRVALVENITLKKDK